MRKTFCAIVLKSITAKYAKYNHIEFIHNDNSLNLMLATKNVPRFIYACLVYMNHME